MRGLRQPLIRQVLDMGHDPMLQDVMALSKSLQFRYELIWCRIGLIFGKLWVGLIWISQALYLFFEY